MRATNDEDDARRCCGNRGQISDGSRAEELRSYGRSVGRLHVIYLNYEITEPWRTSSAEEATGSCWFVRLPGEDANSPPRYMMTCNHCVQGSMQHTGLYVRTPHTGSVKISARLVIAMPEIDGGIVELLDTNGVNFSNFRALELGDDKRLGVGDSVQVYGYPMSQNKLKMSECKITGREDGLIMLDGSINYGHSGGPIINDGVVVGWVTMGMPQANAISFAQPISYLRAVMRALVPPDTGALIVRKGSMGVKYYNGSEDRLIALGARGQSCDAEDPCACESGVVIQWVSRLSDLAREPFDAHPGDVICSIDVPLEVDDEVRLVSLQLDNTGQVSVPWMDDKVDLSVIMTLVPIGLPIKLSIWKSQQRRLVSGMVRLKDTYKNGYFSPYFPYEKTKYEIFGGIIVAEMNADILDEFARLSVCLTDDEKEEPKLIIVKVYLGSPLDTSRDDLGGNVNEGAIVLFVNGYRVTNIEEYRSALRDPVEGRFLSIVTEKLKGDVISMSKVLNSEIVLAQQYGYPLSDTYKHYALKSYPAWHGSGNK